MSTSRLSDVVQQWQSRLTAYKEATATVDGVQVCELVLRDLEAISSSEAGDEVSLGEAAAISGYARDSLTRMVREGRLANVGSRHRPRFRRGDLPRRSEPRSTAPLALQRPTTAPSAAAIVRDAISSRSAR